MSSRAQQKAEARERRLAAEREREAQVRRRRTIRLGALGLAALVAVVAIVLLAGGGGDDSADRTAGGNDGSGVAGVAESEAMLEGIPQNGTTLGDPKAKVVLTEYADLQCPFCAQYATDVLPQLIEEYVRPGKLRLEMRLLRFLGPDSDRGAQAAHVAADDNRMWNFVDLWYRNQGPENSDYADDDFIQGLADAAGVPADEAITAANNGSRGATIEQAEQEAELLGVESTPSFFVGADAASGEPIEVGELSFEAFSAALAPHLR